MHKYICMYILRLGLNKCFRVGVSVALAQYFASSRQSFSLDVLTLVYKPSRHQHSNFWY